MELAIKEHKVNSVSLHSSGLLAVFARNSHIPPPSPPLDPSGISAAYSSEAGHEGLRFISTGPTRTKRLEKPQFDRRKRFGYTIKIQKMHMHGNDGANGFCDTIALRLPEQHNEPLRIAGVVHSIVVEADFPNPSKHYSFDGMDAAAQRVRK